MNQILKEVKSAKSDILEHLSNLEKLREELKIIDVKEEGYKSIEWEISKMLEETQAHKNSLSLLESLIQKQIKH